MSRKIWKILISLLFLVVAAVAAVFTIKIFSHDKSISAPVRIEEGRENVSFYGVAPISRPSRLDTTRYGVVGIGRSRR